MMIRAIGRIFGKRDSEEGAFYRLVTNPDSRESKKIMEKTIRLADKEQRRILHGEKTK